MIRKFVAIFLLNISFSCATPPTDATFVSEAGACAEACNASRLAATAPECAIADCAAIPFRRFRDGTIDEGALIFSPSAGSGTLGWMLPRQQFRWDATGNLEIAERVTPRRTIKVIRSDGSTMITGGGTTWSIATGDSGHALERALFLADLEQVH